MAIDHVLPHDLDDQFGPGAEHADDEASIDTFLAEYDADSDIWWTLGPGEMQHRFEQLIDLYAEGFQLLQNLVESITEDQDGDFVTTYVDDLDVLSKAQDWLSKR